MSKIVNTTIPKMFANLVAPDACCHCSEIGAIICDRCIFNILEDVPKSCIICGIYSKNGACSDCLEFDKVFWLGYREDILKSLISATKNDCSRSGAMFQAVLLSKIMPRFLNAKVVVVPSPTAVKHQRIRGFAHSEKTAKYLSKLVNVKYQNMIRRKHQLSQTGKNRETRIKQAETAYTVEQKCYTDWIYILVDDVFTTGATSQNIAKQLKLAGATQVWLAVTSKQRD